MDIRKIDKYFNFLDVPPTPLIGVDLSSSSIKCVELSKNRKGIQTLENFSIEPTPADAFNEQGLGNIDALSAALLKAWKKLGTKVKNIAIAIPGNIAITKRVKFPKELDEIAIEEEVLIEAAQFIPFNLDDVHIDWQFMGPHPNAPETHNEILICASRRDRITDYMAVAEGAGLKVHTVDIDTFAKQLAFESIYANNPDTHHEVTALIDAGRSTVQVMVYKNGTEIVFNKDIAFGANQLTDAICHVYGISPEQADDAKRKGGEGLTEYNEQVLSPFLENLGLEINRSLQFFLTQATVEKIDKIILAGGCAAYNGAAEIIGNNTQISTIACNPFAHMQYSGKVKNKNLSVEAPLLLTACGLALRRFDT